jgi:hypothetical protein
MSQKIPLVWSSVGTILMGKLSTSAILKAMLRLESCLLRGPIWLKHGRQSKG